MPAGPAPMIAMCPLLVEPMVCPPGRGVVVLSGMGGGQAGYERVRVEGLDG